MKKRITIIATAALLAAALSFAGEPVRWLNVHVVSHEDNAKVDVRVPMNLVTAVLGSVKTDQIRAGKIRLDVNNVQIDWPKLLNAIKQAPDARFVTIASDDADVTISKKAGTVFIKVHQKTQHKADVNVQIPESLLGAISIDQQNRLDLNALLQALGKTTRGDLVRVTAPDADVRVWID
jgi:hypothetical protein